MKKMLYRIAAFCLDIALVSLIIFGLSSIRFINPNINKINYEYEKVSQSQESYLAIKDEISEITKDSKVSDEEYEKIVNEYPDYLVLFNEVDLNEDLTNKFIDSLPAEIDLRYQDVLTKYNYNIQKLSIYENIIAVVVYILYFGVYAYVMKGQTIFKKIFKLRTVDLNDIEKKVPLWKYILKAILICEIVLLGLDIICVALLKESLYINVTYWISQIKYIYEMAFIVTIIMRDDQRSIHDLILNTKVIRYGKDGKVIEEQLFVSVEKEDKKEIEEAKEVKKKAPTKKKSTNKKKEVVKAEKVND